MTSLRRVRNQSILFSNLITVIRGANGKPTVIAERAARLPETEITDSVTVHCDVNFEEYTLKRSLFCK